MTAPKTDTSFTEDMASFYESILVPLIFEPYAADLGARVRALNPTDVLEVACGTGVGTRALSAALPPTCAITATDLNDALVAHGQTVAGPAEAPTATPTTGTT